jgi:ubiquinone/menaquinone biosynthesis C-methylase UbiE
MTPESQFDLENIYKRRFGPDVEFRKKMWQVLCRDFFQSYVSKDGCVVELAAGYCEFINSIQAREKIAVDLNPDTQKHADPDVRVIRSSTSDLSGIEPASVDTVFVSNFFEHLTHEQIVLTLRQVVRILKPGGKLLVLQPNYRYCYRDYWMFFDHITAIDDRGLVEGLEANGFQILKSIPRFLPFTTKSSLPNSLFLLKLYLKLPIAWRIFGGQAFIVAKI